MRDACAPVVTPRRAMHRTVRTAIEALRVFPHHRLRSPAVKVASCKREDFMRLRFGALARCAFACVNV